MANQLVSEFINALAKQSGIDMESKEVKDFFASPGLIDLNIDDSLIKQMQSSFMTFESAKNNHDLQKHFTGSTLSGIDNAVSRALKKGNVSPEVMKLLEGDGTTLQKTEAVIGKIIEESKKPQDNPDTEKLIKEKEELSSKVNELTEKVNSFPTTLESELNTLKNKHESDLIGYEITNKLSGYKFNSTIPREDINDIVSNKIAKMPYVLRKEEGELKVYQKDSPTLLAQKDNKTLTVGELLDSVVSPYVDKGGESKPAGEPAKTEPTGKKSTYNSTLQEKMEAAAGAGIKPANFKE